ncbi:MAG: hypothetical protein MRY79_09380 [Alphaproteobacteria bacterium]|nr:hypothetical protein [Alphaproteobacteria bacterium]
MLRSLIALAVVVILGLVIYNFSQNTSKSQITSGINNTVNKGVNAIRN